MYSSNGVYRRLPENILPKADEYFGVPRYKTQKEKEEGGSAKFGARKM